MNNFLECIYMREIYVKKEGGVGGLSYFIILVSLVFSCFRFFV